MASVPGYDLYGGATITRVIDGAGAEWIGCTARRLSDSRFGFTLFRNGVEVEYQPFCAARGTISEDGHWIAFNGKLYYSGPIPGFVPLPNNARPPVVIPPNGAIDNLYDGVYVPADFDTPAEIALRVQKQLDALQELVALLKKAGVLIE